MARFRAFASDSGSSSDEEPQRPVQTQQPQKQKSPKQAPRRAQDERFSESEGSEEGESSSSSEMEEDELDPSPRRRRTRDTRDRNALVEDENGEIQYAHEAEIRVSPPSSPPRESPRRLNIDSHGDPTITPWAHHVGVDAQRMHVMQAALFRLPEEEAALRARYQPPKTGIKVDTKSKINRKHSRDSDGDGLRMDSRERTSFGHDIEPQIFRPTRKYARVGITSSIANDNEGAYVDAGLAMGRSFRVGWGPGGVLVHLGNICGPGTTTTASANSSTITITKVLRSISTIRPDTTGSAPPASLNPRDLACKLLQHQLSHTTISRDESDIPCAYPNSPSTTPSQAPSSRTHAPAPSPDPLYFSSFASLFPTDDTSTPAPIFRLGSALFDPISLNLRSRSNVTGVSNITPDLRNRVSLLRRKTALSKWLESVVRPVVDGELRIQSSGSNATYTPADAAFTQLTGHQISEACQTAADGGYLKLATLISQAGGDALFREDILSQLEIWKAEKLAPGSNKTLSNSQNGLVGRGVWRIYTLLSGLEKLQGGGDSENTSLEDDFFAGLDWKRVFGLFLWYGTEIDASVADVVVAYEHILLEHPKTLSTDIARPIPKWAAASNSNRKGVQLPLVPGPGLGLYKSATTPKETGPHDPLYVLIKLHADPALSLTHSLNPLSYAPSAMDWGIGMCWHLYIILSRVMRVRDFGDRADPGVRITRVHSSKRRTSMINGFRSGSRGVSLGSDERSSKDGEDEDDVQPEGHSPTADLLASSYAFELESWDLIQEAAFVLLHLEGGFGREKALKDLLARSGPKLDDWQTRALVGSLKLPMTWIDEAKAMYELDCGHVFAAYELYISAQLYNAAHTIAVLELAPDAIIRKDLELLRSLFAPFDNDGKRDKIEGWFVRGKVLLDYVETMIQLPRLLNEVLTENEEAETMPDAARTARIDTLSKRIPRMIALLPDILHRKRAVDPRHVAALEEMTKDLLKLEEKARPLLLSQIHQSTLGALDGATKINLIKGLGYARFLQSVEP
ncbi:hypothetical protein BDN70DRAFT_862477 [Pholiota conissans]|uniref:Nuclear pore complex protein NUP96 C-terminal domain-containing protein n=1 Tax=Pholiota conissans TaxID=109636 RepID=A0A9P6CXX5_9AGAR|nr:hypothetical protein BDN70DRAFT_862477 [Pholiota conissans]